MPSTLFSSLLILLLLLCREVRSYVAPKEELDVFERTACPAFLSFTNVAFLAGTTVELQCRCKPRQIQSVVWFYKKQLDSFEETRALADDHGHKLLDTSEVPHSGNLKSRFSIRLFSLFIFRASRDDSGLYICGSSRKDYFSGYDLDIQKADRISFTPRLLPKITSKNQKKKDGPISTQQLYQVFTQFKPWSVCDRCGVPGEQVRVGLCYINTKYLHMRYRLANETASCSSGAVPRAFRSLEKGKMGATLEIRSCKVNCSAQSRTPQKDSTWKDLLGLGFSGDVPVFFLSHPEDNILTLGCPGAQPDMAVAWDVGSKPIYRSKHLSGTNTTKSSRLQIDTGHHLVFKPANTEDSGVYYCWIQGRLAAQINLLIHFHLGRGPSVVSHPDFPIAVKTVSICYAAMTGAFLLLILARVGVRYCCKKTLHFREGDASESKHHVLKD